MKHFTIFLIASISLIIMHSNASGWCIENKDWPDAPCYASFQDSMSSFHDKIQKDWEPYYDFKGESIMKSKLLELEVAIRNNMLQDWLEKSSNPQEHENIHYYYFLQGEVPNSDGLFFDEATQAKIHSESFSIGQIQFPDRCYSSIDVGTVRVIDPDMNADPQKAESVPVYLWANTDADVRNPNAVETGPDTGIFETAVFLNAYDESFSQRIRALEGDVLYARYVDETVPFDQKQVIETLVTIGALSPQQRWGEPWPERSQLNNSTYVYDACLSEFMDEVGRDNSGLDWLDVTYPAPLKQIESGLFFDEVICKDDFELAFKHDDTPACVTEQTKQKLIERGWTRIMSANMTLHATQQWGYIKDISMLNSNYIGVTMSYPTNEAYHELYPDESNPIVGNCDVQNDSANLSILHLNDIDSDANTITFTKENKIFDGMSCDDAFWDEMTRYGYCGPPSHLTLQREILMSSITDAQNMVDFTLVVPKYLPEGYDVQKIMVDGDKKHVTLFISPMPVTNETDMCKFTWDNEGIYLSYVSLPEDAPRFSNDPDRERITINENRGYVKYREIGDRAGTPIPQGSEVTWHIPEGNLVLNMYSSLSSEELIKIAESIGELESKPNILLDIARIEENRIALNPTDTCAHISLRLLSADKLEQYQTRDKEVRFFEITETDLQELPVLDELIQATHHLEFTTNDDARAEMGLRELVDYEFFIMEKSITKYNDSQDDYFLKLDGNLDEKLADPKPQGFSNEFLSPQIVYDDKVYVLSHTFFWVANEHETQHMSVHLQDSLDNNKKFITLTDEDMESIPKIKQAIEKIGTEFESIHASKGLPENPDWNEYREWFGQKKTEQFNLDETYVPGFVYNDEYYDLGFPIC